MSGRLSLAISRTDAPRVMHLLGKCISFLSGEYLLLVYPNGGAVVFLRAFHVAIVLFVSAIGVCELLDPETERIFSWLEFRIQAGAHITWFGAIFAGVYALLYARFSSQWTYLAGVYNQIKSAELRKDTDDAALAGWKAGFIEDCQDLHLLRKPMFASIVHAWLSSGELGLPVRECFKTYTPGGADRLSAIQDQVTLVVTRSGGSALSGDSDAERTNDEHLHSAISRRTG
jgi:hypothetical protein